MIIVCDVDGTISNHDHRFHLVQKKPKNFPEYYRLTAFDPPYEKALRPLVQMVHLAGPSFFYFLTGRPEELRHGTTEWIYKNYGIECVPKDVDPRRQGQVRLLMRPDHDYRPAVVFKDEALMRIRTAFRYPEPMLLIDDDLRNLEMYKKYGIVLKAPECWEVLW